MSIQTTGIAIAVVLALLVKFFNRTDTPKIKNLPEVPGVPIFGNLLQFGSHHAKVASQLAKRYGPVFQVRLGNRVRPPLLTSNESLLVNSILRELFLPTPSTRSVTSG